MNIGMHSQASSSPGEKVVNEVDVTTPENSMLAKDDFLKILIAQLQNQDPLDPMDDREFIAQMAQFSSLEQMTNINNAMERFLSTQERLSLVQFSELIGTPVKWEIQVEASDGEEGQFQENEVLSVRKTSEGTIKLLLDNERWIDSSQLVKIGLDPAFEN
ncbi:flagellar basal-body rod modification protein FlgD [Geomicrobium halophilum]|uniref:Flagellar basal-body rod modification protein FlgD n=1 Tax=Geomicrobium halophilum TaxID=549000 RepID=A0A841PNE8_9BACL|nr:flagellar hook assembly protein FlgD [Geomicrobium halophilum]MBB6449294.1 flagellar basal-body rod modification protein FlgD [Geomicrobium halophilum]